MSSSGSNRRDILRHSLWYSVGSLLENLSSLVTGFFVARWLGPSIQGVWQTARLVLSYSDFSTLGQGLGMQREVGVALGRKDEEGVRGHRDTGFCWSALLMLAAGAATAAYALEGVHDPRFRGALFAIAAMVSVNGVNSYFNLWYKAVGRFGILTIAALLRGAVLLGVVLLIWKFGFSGLLWGSVVAALAVGVFYWIVAREKPRLRIVPASLRSTLSIGFPVFLVGLSGLLFASLDRIIVVGRMGFVDMGFYSVSTMLFMPIQVALSSAAIVLFPDVCRSVGADNTGRGLAKYLLEPIDLLVSVLPVVSVGMVVILPAVIDVLLPAYHSGLRPAQIAIWGLSFSSASAYCWNIVVGSGRTWWLVFISLVSSLIKLMLALLLVDAGYGLSGVAAATMISYAIQFGFIFLAAARIAHVPRGLGASVLLRAAGFAAAAAAVSFFIGDVRQLFAHGLTGLVPRTCALLVIAVPGIQRVLVAMRKHKNV